MPLVTLQDVSIRFRGPPLLEDACLQLDPGQRVALLGRNGEGKSTLLGLIHGTVEPDRGEVVLGPKTSTALLTQLVPADMEGPIFDVVAAGLGRRGQLLADFHHASEAFAREGSTTLQRRLDRLQHDLDTTGGWQIHNEVEQLLDRMDLDPEAEVSILSAGMKRRVLLAQAIVSRPDLLLLDEPTNHLDIDAIDWLEEFLFREGLAFLFVTHDRAFLKKLATRIVELDRGRLTGWECDYETFLDRREAASQAEQQQRALFDKRLAEEEAWIRQGIKARRTRNEGRVRALEEMRRQRSDRRDRPGTARIQLQQAERSGRLVIQAKRISHTFDVSPVVADFSTLITRGDRIGIIGPNGSGKTTLLRILLAELEPSAGSIRHGTSLEVAYFDQFHAQLDEDQTAGDNVSGGSQSVVLDGQNRHILGYMQDFLFTPEQARGSIKYLSGGERNRLLLARLFARPSNLLVMDEPTNDLDIETLELLEERLLEYDGTLLLVSHDREFLNNVVTRTFVFEGEGHVKEYAGGYDDWLHQRATAKPDTPPPVAPATSPPKTREKARPTGDASSAGKRSGLKYAEQIELKALPERIEQLETHIAAMYDEMSVPEFYQQDRALIVETTEKLESLESELAEAYARWEYLENR